VGAAVLLGGVGLAALWQHQGWRLAGMCIGFLPVFGMALHNWYYGGEFVLFTNTRAIAAALSMAPSAYWSALSELLRFDFRGGNFFRGALQVYRMLIGPSESFAMMPMHLAALVIIVRVMLTRRYDGGLRLVAATTLGLITPALFFVYSDRYHILSWLFMLLICSVWVRDEGWPWLSRHFPTLADGATHQPMVIWLERRLDALARAAGILPL
jgi:hypothetical protein